MPVSRIPERVNEDDDFDGSDIETRIPDFEISLTGMSHEIPDIDISGFNGLLAFKIIPSFCSIVFWSSVRLYLFFRDSMTK